jgi:phosphate:Na+ symporter
MLNLVQAIGVIMGANVGTTFSGQLVAFKIDWVAPLFIFVGVIMNFFFKKRKIKDIGYVVLGFGVLFFGISTMGTPLMALRNEPSFNEFLVNFTNPILALLAGFVFTAIIQSSSATMGILVALHLSGVPLDFRTSAFIILGMNIGTSITTVVSSIPASRESKRAAIFHIMYDIIGSTVFGTLIFIFPQILEWFESTWAEKARQVAMFHTLYNVATMLILLPFINYIAVMMKKIVPGSAIETDNTYEKKLVYLDSQTMESPAVSVLNAHLELCRMGKIANENFALATEAFFENDAEKVKKTLENEKIVDYLNHKIASKLVHINGMSLSPLEAKKIGKMFIILSDIERIGDHAENIAGYVKTMENNDLKFSETAVEELKRLVKLTKDITVKALNVYENQKDDEFSKIKKLDGKINTFAAKCVVNHVERLKTEICRPECGVIFTDMITDLSRSADHAKNIASSVSLERKWNK